MLEGKSDDTHVIRELRFVLGDSFFASNARTRPDFFRSIGVGVNFWLILFYELMIWNFCLVNLFQIVSVFYFIQLIRDFRL